MSRIRTLATILFLIIIPSLFIYYLYYDSISTSMTTRYQPSGQQQSVEQHKYAAVWRHMNSIFNQQQNNNISIIGFSLNYNFSYVNITPPIIPSPNESKDPNPEIENKRQLIKEMMKEAWNNYVKYAWGYNELQPLTRNGKLDSIFGATKLGLTIVDSMDTLFLMDMKQEFEMGRRWIANELDFKSVETEISVFETIIRYVGGLLTCYALTGDPMFLHKSREIAQILLPAYNTNTGIPNGLIIPKTGKNYHHNWAYGAILSEFGSHHLEYTYLSDMTGDHRFRERVQRIRNVLQDIEKPNGLYLLILDNMSGHWVDNKVSLGALGDSFYEYLIKSYVQSGHRDKKALKMYIEAMDAIDRSGMINQSNSGHLTYVSDLMFGQPTNKMQHLTCFAGGMYMLGTQHMSDSLNMVHDDSTKKTSNNSGDPNYNRIKRHFNLAVNITETCYQSYHRTPTHLGPETFFFDEESEAINNNGDYYILRPEVIESYFIMWRMTHDKRYRDYAWEAAEAINKHCRTGNGFTGIYNVMNSPVINDNTQQSFFLAETLKYLYLIFSNDKLLPLDQWVFNTEAHPLPICGHNSAYPSSVCNHDNHDINNNNNNNNN